MIIDGRALAHDVLGRTKERALTLPHAPRVLALVANETPATRSYLSIKGKRAADAGCVLEIRQLSELATTGELQAAVKASDADAIIVQLPLPKGVDSKTVCDEIPISKDADVLSASSREQFERGDVDALLSPVVSAVQEIFRQGNVSGGGKKAIVIGEGFLVGVPIAAWLRRQGAQVTVLNRSTMNTNLLLEADIIVSGAGDPHFIKPEMIKDGVVLIDAGTSESGGAVVGDADFGCAEKCSLFTPVPGGVGPIAVACLFENAVSLAGKTLSA